MRRLPFFLFLFCLVHSQALRADAPNVILILADDMALGDLASLNGGISHTPNIDRLKKDGLWFENAYSGSAVCAPARAALFTGRYPHRTGCVTLNMPKYPVLSRIKTSETTIGDLMKMAGYATGLIGKWHSGMGDEYHPTRRGFDEFEGFVGAHEAEGYFDYVLESDGVKRPVKDKYLTEDLSARAVKFVKRHKHHPFFLHLAHYAPHRPLDAPEASKQPWLKAGYDESTATIYAMIEIMDRGIGELIEALEEEGLKEKTLILFASDNGPDPLTGARFNRNLRGMKYEIHEGGIRVPFIMHWPGTLKPGTREELIHFTDVLPTIMEICGQRIPNELKLDGRSFAGLLSGESVSLPKKRYWQWNRKDPRYGHNAAMREDQWKLVRPFVTRNIPKPNTAKPFVLYNLADDPAESTDVSKEHPERFERMKQDMKKWATEVEASRVK